MTFSALRLTSSQRQALNKKKRESLMKEIEPLHLKISVWKQRKPLRVDPNNRIILRRHIYNISHYILVSFCYPLKISTIFDKIAGKFQRIVCNETPTGAVQTTHVRCVVLNPTNKPGRIYGFCKQITFSLGHK